MTAKDVLPEKDLLEVAATMKRFEYLPLRIKTQTDIANRQYPKLDKSYKFDEKIKKL